MSWLHYLIEANLYLTVFYMLYCLLLNKETYYTLNRAYLILTCIISFILPMVQIGVLKPIEAGTPIETFANIPADPTTFIEAPVKAAAKAHFTWQDGLFYTYVLGATVLLLLLLIKIYRLFRLTKSNKKAVGTRYKLVYLRDSNTAFSFFNFLFIGTKIGDTDTVIKHELVHIRQKHSADIIFIELLKIISWFNPCIYLLQRSMKAVHEFIADEKTAGPENGALAYCTFLVSNAYGLSGSSITHSFFNYNLLKKRIIMLHQKRSGNLARLKYLLALPVCAGLLCASTLAFSKDYGWINLLPQKADTSRIDPPPPPAPPATATNQKAPPPPPAPPVGNSKIAPPPPPADPMVKVGETANGYNYKQTEYLQGDKINFKVVLREKNGLKTIYVKSSATPDDIALLSDKYGYTFPSNGKYKLMAPGKVVKFPPPVILPNKPLTAAQQQMKPPPPPPFESVYRDFFAYVQNNLPYPKDAASNNIQGHVVAQFTLDDNHHITAVSITNSSDKTFDDHVINAIKTYNGNIAEPAGNYTLGINFDIQGQSDRKVLIDGDAKMMQVPNIIGIITVVGESKSAPPANAPKKAMLNRGNDSTSKSKIKTPPVAAATSFNDMGSFLQKLYYVANGKHC